MDPRRLKFLGMVSSRLRNILYLLRLGKFRNAYSYLWSAVMTRDSGIALLDPLWRRFPWLTPYPEAIEIEPTTRCHLRCVICEHTYWDEAGRDMTYNEFLTIMRQFPHLKWIGMTGIGSSFLNPDYLRMLAYVKERGVYVEFFDTFSLVDETIASRLVDLAVDKIWLSFEAATRQTYERIRVGASFDRVLENVKRFLEIKRQRRALLPELWFHYIINTHNVHEAAAYVDFVADLMRDVPQASVLIFYTGLMEFKEVLDLRVQALPAGLREEVHRRGAARGVRINWNENIARAAGPSRCTKWTEPFILSSGHIQPCCVLNEANARQFQRDHAFMNVFEGDFHTFWRSKEFRAFLATLSSNRFPRVCTHCKVYSPQKT